MAGILGGVEDFVHFVDDGQVDRVLLPELPGGAAGADAFGDHRHAGEDFGERAPFAELGADETIARKVAGSGKDQIAEAGESAERTGMAAESDREASDFSQAAGDQRGDTVAAKSKPATEAGGDGDHVFERPADLNAGNVAAGIETKFRSRESLLYISSKSRVVSSDDDGGRFTGGDFTGESGAGENRRRPVPQDLRNHLRHATE